MSLRGDQPLTALPGVGARIAEKLAAMGLQTPHDLLFHLPLRYEDRTRITPLNRLQPGQVVQVEGRVVSQTIRQARTRMLIATLTDDQALLQLRFFRFFPNQQRLLAEGARLRCFGEVRLTMGGYEIIHPQCVALGSGEGPPLPEALTPVYPVTQGVSQALMARLVATAVQALRDRSLVLDDVLAGKTEGPDLCTALLTVHAPNPDTHVSALLDGSHPAIRRLALEELLAHHLTLAQLNQARAQQQASALSDPRRPDGLWPQLLGHLPFQPTGAQQRVIDEILTDVTQVRPMRRLLQGDVGSGKTLVAAATLLAAVAAGRQAALIAPTELLAEQHQRTLGAWFDALGVKWTWLAGKVQGRARRQALSELAGDTQVAIGTHALFQAGVAFRDLALIVIDEQHRFGVHQRLALAAKGQVGGRLPHQLVMTATPIPRTLAMTSYAGLDVSVIDELPPGRLPVTTVAISQQRRDEVIERLAQALRSGRQAYWVCPLIEDSDLIVAEAAETRAKELTTALPQMRIGLVHGRMKPAEKQAVMAQFLAAELDVLVATTVIEVGVDVANASLMIIENAERLGLAQLHQLRGRVGRGSEQAACVLLYRAPLGEMARQRLEVMRETTDGFVIAEQDLALRGPGEVLGTRQTGLLRFRVADLARDASVLEALPELAARLTASDQQCVMQRWVGDAQAFVDV